MFIGGGLVCRFNALDGGATGALADRAVVLIVGRAVFNWGWGLQPWGPWEPQTVDLSASAGL